MGTCGSPSVQSCLTGSATSCSKQDGTARAGSNAQHKSLMGRTRKSSGTTKRPKMNCPTGELHVNPCSAIIAAITHLPAMNNCPIPAFSEALGMHVLALGYLKTLSHWRVRSVKNPSKWGVIWFRMHWFFAHLILIFLNTSPKPSFKLTKIYIFVTSPQKIFLTCSCLAYFQTIIDRWKGVSKITSWNFPCKTTP